MPFLGRDVTVQGKPVGAPVPPSKPNRRILDRRNQEFPRVESEIEKRRRLEREKEDKIERERQRKQDEDEKKIPPNVHMDDQVAILIFLLTKKAIPKRQPPPRPPSRTPITDLPPVPGPPTYRPRYKPEDFEPKTPRIDVTPRFPQPEPPTPRPDITPPIMPPPPKAATRLPSSLPFPSRIQMPRVVVLDRRRPEAVSDSTLATLVPATGGSPVTTPGGT